MKVFSKRHLKSFHKSDFRFQTFFYENFLFEDDVSIYFNTKDFLNRDHVFKQFLAFLKTSVIFCIVLYKLLERAKNSTSICVKIFFSILKKMQFKKSPVCTIKQGEQIKISRRGNKS